IAQLKAEGHDVKVLFLTASTESLVARFSETRRSHPLSHRIGSNQNPTDRLTLTECIQTERELLVDVEGLAHTIDTSNLSTNKLRRWIKDLIDTEEASLTLMFESFAFKHGVPLDADLVFDVRMLPNPHYDPLLRPFTGRDQPVAAFLSQQPQVADLLNDISAFVAKWLPSFKQDNRSYLTVAIGCTGGQHRSVYMVEQLAKQFTHTERVIVRHRQLND
ncbi:MAG: RNase adapter RapZ, partial [Glaciimonas sp.]|nr:RNase adapter RapZ [Glaciimonas sp.]